MSAEMVDKAAIASAPRRVAMVPAIALIPAMVMGCVLMLPFLFWSTYYPYPKQELSTHDRQVTLLIAKIPPMWAILHFQDANEFKRTAPKGSGAYAHLGGDACTITIPAIGHVGITPAEPLSAHFIERDVADTLAHELMHCALGHWHAEP